MMESATESCVPPGFRFHPTDEELVGYYLRKKVASQKIDLGLRLSQLSKFSKCWDGMSLSVVVVAEKCGIGYEEQKEWYFFSHRDKKYPTGTRTNRATAAGFWKATGRDKAVYDGAKLIGMRKTLVFYKGRAPHGQKTDWIMHEYRLDSDDNPLPQEEGWVVCRAFKKRTTIGNSKTITASTYYHYDGVSTAMDSITRWRQQNHCKHELESSHFVQLPQLQSPSLPPISNSKPQSNIIEDRYDVDPKKVMDWRDLDKFVASQLSHGDEFEVGRGLENCYDSEMGLLLLQSGREEAAGSKLLIQSPLNF